MNTKNNQRAKDTEMRVEAVFLSLLSKKHISKITVREVCEGAGITRTSFYSHYEDVYDLLHKIEHKVTVQMVPFLTDKDTQQVHITRDSFVKIFRFIGENRIFYQYYFQNTNEEITFTLNHIRHFPKEYGENKETLSPQRQYRIAFFMGGLNAIIRQWLERDCADTPEEMVTILETEYQAEKIWK